MQRFVLFDFGLVFILDGRAEPSQEEHHRKNVGGTVEEGNKSRKQHQDDGFGGFDHFGDCFLRSKNEKSNGHRLDKLGKLECFWAIFLQKMDKNSR